jgi:hypothetical protein
MSIQRRYSFYNVDSDQIISDRNCHVFTLNLLIFCYHIINKNVKHTNVDVCFINLIFYDWSSIVTKWYIHVRVISNSYRFLQVHFVFLNTLGIISSYLKIDLFVYSDTHTTSTTSTKFVNGINPDSFWGKLDLCYYIFLQYYKVPMSKIWMYLF